MKLLLGLLTLIILNAKCAGQSIKVGSKVEVQWTGGYWYPATIVDESDTQYKIHLDAEGVSTARDQWINKNNGLIRDVKNKTTVKAAN